MEQSYEDSLPTREELDVIIRNLCVIKKEEFAAFGYDHVEWEEIWHCVSSKYKKSGLPPLHKLVNDILTLKADQFMNWITLQAMKGASF
ncbi:hypothetical protein J31TS4_25100 [Paenibacillus sp. J31TS4]|uniref:post-transcriptional regulator n=1 Tax=Paenibacillus sp. J31TS4 TaxID=2807195 RepID=UPI001B07C0EF|nr:post-transcriptional regulator [Paenibacillus sp. J31TS4]GIP39230.1 hypothetical protein J31TS4_25100 [Paenibacillus sp. J31TS4]